MTGSRRGYEIGPERRRVNSDASWNGMNGNQDRTRLPRNAMQCNAIPCHATWKEKYSIRDKQEHLRLPLKEGRGKRGK